MFTDTVDYPCNDLNHSSGWPCPSELYVASIQAPTVDFVALDLEQALIFKALNGSRLQK